jgi:hypothetical protein
MGTGAENYGPTSATGYYNGITPPSGGYTVYSLMSGNVPAIWVAHNDSELIDIALTLGSGTVNGAGAREYLSTLANTWIVNSNPDNIVTKDLILDYNFTNLSTYPGSGTTVGDLSGGARNGILYNNPTFNSNGYFEFDGVDDSITTSNTSGVDFSDQQTICFLLKPGTGSGNARRNIWDQAYGGSGTWTHETNGVISYYFGTNGGNASPYTNRSSGFTVVAGEKAHVVSTRNQTTGEVLWYKNGVLLTSISAGGYSATSNGTATARIGLGYTGNRFIGDIYDIKIYNRALTAEEVSQNYYLGPIITDDLVQFYDFGNILCHEGVTGNAAGAVVNMVDGVTANIVNTNNAISYNKNQGYMEWDGTSTAYINIPDTGRLNNFTLSAWVYNMSGGNSRHSILTNYWEIVGTSLQFWSYEFDNDYWRSTSNGQVPYNTWTYITTTWDGERVRHYINGTLVYTQPNTSGGTSQTLQKMAGYGGRQYYGRIGVLSIYDACLNSSEIMQNFNAHSSRFK